jgi:hypothetical protein
MAAQNDLAEHDDQDQRLDISDEDAEQLLADGPDDDDDRTGRSDRDDRRDRKGRDSREDDEDDDRDEPLGDRGRRALEAMKEQRKAARAERDRAKQELDDLRKKLDKYESANKSELQRLIEERDTLKAELGKVSSTAKRRDIAEELAPEHATAKQIRMVAQYLRGSTDEELEASAEELFSHFAPEPSKPRTPSRPKERLRGGGEPDEEPTEVDPRKLADLIRKSR